MTQEKRSLKLEDNFCFACHSGLECYTSCCRDVNIFLTPNDVIRMKTALEMNSTDFLKKYTDVVVVPDRHLPLVQLRMNAEDNNKCFFVRPHGCLIYAHRPWACRMFPLDEGGAGGFSVIATGDRCHGLVKGDDWQVKAWLKDQGAIQAKEADGSYDALAAHEFMRKLDIENQQILNMVITALYDVDGFRKLVFESSFLDKFELEQERIDICKTEDVAMLDLGFDWVRFGLLGQRTLKVKESAIKAAKAAG